MVDGVPTEWFFAAQTATPTNVAGWPCCATQNPSTGAINCPWPLLGFRIPGASGEDVGLELPWALGTIINGNSAGSCPSSIYVTSIYSAGVLQACLLDAYKAFQDGLWTTSLAVNVYGRVPVRSGAFTVSAGLWHYGALTGPNGFTTNPLCTETSKAHTYTTLAETCPTRLHGTFTMDRAGVIT